MNKMAFLRTSWMRRYQGIKEDTPSSGGAYVVKTGVGGEIYDFRPHRGRINGYVSARHESLDLQRMDPSADADRQEGVLAVWTARHPFRGVRIIGWYKNATVYSDPQKPAPALAREYKNLLPLTFRAVYAPPAVISTDRWRSWSKRLRPGFGPSSA